MRRRSCDWCCRPGPTRRWPLHRLLVSGQLTQLRMADLAFTVPEVDDLLAGYDYRPRLSDDDLALLQARTEGWAAGLRLAAVSMQHQPDLHRFVTELAGDDRSLAGYLVSEVLEQQPAELRSFLLRTCVVGELSGELADALTGRDDGERILARLEQANAFVMALGSRHKWYRYHPLFAELLRYQLRREAPHEVIELRHRAARWYAGHELPVEAVQQAATVRDWGYAAELIAEHGLGRTLHGQDEAFRDLLDLLPADLARLDPELALLMAAQRIAADDGAEASLQLAREQEPLLAAERRPRFALVLATCRLLRAGRAGDLDELLAAGGEALAAHGQLDAADAGGMAAAARAVALAGLGTAELWTGALDAAEEHLQAGQAAALGAGLDDLQLDCLSRLALLQAVGGRLSLAARTGGARGRARRGRTRRSPGALLALAWVHYQRDDLVLAGSYLERAAEQAGGAPDLPLRAAVRLLRGRLRWAEGDPAGALAELGAARHELGDRDPPGLLTHWLSTTEAELRLAAGDAGPATALLGSFGTGDPVEEPEAVARAGLQLALDDPAAAVGTLSPFLDAAEARNQAGHQHPGLAAARAGQPRARPGGPGGGVVAAGDRPGRAGGAPADLPRCRSSRARRWSSTTATGSTSSWPFLDELALASLDPAPAVMSPMPVLIETLSERERAVLRYLPTMLTFVEIGSELYISVNTTKSHVRSIYRKLGVVGRRDAVRRARQLQLLRS